MRTAGGGGGVPGGLHAVGRRGRIRARLLGAGGIPPGVQTVARRDARRVPQEGPGRRSARGRLASRPRRVAFPASRIDAEGLDSRSRNRTLDPSVLVRLESWPSSLSPLSSSARRRRSPAAGRRGRSHGRSSEAVSRHAISSNDAVAFVVSSGEGRRSRPNGVRAKSERQAHRDRRERGPTRGAAADGAPRHPAGGSLRPPDARRDHRAPRTGGARLAGGQRPALLQEPVRAVRASGIDAAERAHPLVLQTCRGILRAPDRRRCAPGSDLRPLLRRDRRRRVRRYSADHLRRSRPRDFLRRGLAGSRVDSGRDRHPPGPRQVRHVGDRAAAAGGRASSPERQPPGPGGGSDFGASRRRGAPPCPPRGQQRHRDVPGSRLLLRGDRGRASESDPVRPFRRAPPRPGPRRLHGAARGRPGALAPHGSDSARVAAAEHSDRLGVRP